MINPSLYSTKKTYRFPERSVHIYYGTSFKSLKDLLPSSDVFIITDNNVYQLYKELMDSFPMIVIDPGERSKQSVTIQTILDKMLELHLSKSVVVVGVGGGVISDIAGFVASIFKRGTRLVLVPTTILGMVDAALGGKNGIDVGIYKNMLGTIYQPECILYDYSFLDTLPVAEWVNGFAEIIKHGCIRDRILFEMLERFDLHTFQNDKSLMGELIERNVDLKMQIVTKDEMDKQDRQLLNFGHTVGHALENQHQIPHGHAVSIGIIAACTLSEKIAGLNFLEAQRIVKLLSAYSLPVDIETDYDVLYDGICMDKKRDGNFIQFVLIDKIGSAAAKRVPLEFLKANLKNMV